MHRGNKTQLNTTKQQQGNMQPINALVNVFYISPFATKQNFALFFEEQIYTTLSRHTANMKRGPRW